MVPNSWELPLLLAFDLEDLGVARILTFGMSRVSSQQVCASDSDCDSHCNRTGERHSLGESAHIELPPFYVLPCILLRYHNDQLADLAVLHPPIQCRHDLADVCLDLVVARHKHIEAIFLYDGKIFSWVDAALVEDRVDRILELSATENTS